MQKIIVLYAIPNYYSHIVHVCKRKSKQACIKHHTELAQTCVSRDNCQKIELDYFPRKVSVSNRLGLLATYVVPVAIGISSLRLQDPVLN